MSKLKCSAFIRNTSFTEKLKTGKRRLKNWVFVSSVRVRVPSGYWATYCSPRAICIQGCSQVTQAPRLCHLSYIVYTIGNILLHSIYYVGKMKRTIFSKLRVHIKDNNNSLHGKFHRFLFPFSSKFPDINFAPYVLHIYSMLWNPYLTQAVSLGYLWAVCSHVARRPRTAIVIWKRLQSPSK